MTLHLRPPSQVKKVRNVQFGVFDPDLLVRVCSRTSFALQQPIVSDVVGFVLTVVRQSGPEPTLLLSLQRRYSVVKVESSDMYERGRPKVGGLNDLALGTMDRQERCTTDSANAQVPPPVAASV